LDPQDVSFLGDQEVLRLDII